jgi:FtsP/CotA-like multicopper oxidase with cupredoxin domain
MEVKKSMKRLKFLVLMSLVLAVPALFWGTADANFTLGETPDYFGVIPNYANSPTNIQKFQSALPGLTPAGINNLGQYIPIAVADTTTFPGSDYYEIGLVRFTERLHTNLPATPLRGYVQISTGTVPGSHIALTYPADAGGGPILNRTGSPVFGVDSPHYLGPLIIAQKFDPNFAPGAALPGGGTNGKPVRVKFTNYLPTGAAGNLPIPVDTTLMGAGTGFLGTAELYTQNRATLHLHGGLTPWISDGTPYQWTVPAGETTSYPKGASAQSVPDMWFSANGNVIAACSGLLTCGVLGATNDPGPGSMSFYYTNQQSSRLMFYHDHASGITRLNVYAGEAAGYLLTDDVELAMINGGTAGGATYVAGTLPTTQIPLIIQDKTFVDPTTITAQDPTWAWGSNPSPNTTTPGVPTAGDFWWPHVYVPNQHPTAPGGVNNMGRWDYNPWMYPPITTQVIGPVPNPLAGTIPCPGCPAEPPQNPGIPNPTITPESFMDTPMINGTVYPTLKLQAAAYRFRILAVPNDRSLNLQLYKADSGFTTQATAIATVSGGIVTGITPVTAGAGYTGTSCMVHFIGGGGFGAWATATIAGGSVTGYTLTNGGSGYTSAPTLSVGGDTEVKMVPAVSTTGFPATWPTDGRDGGVPDPTTAGPPWIQIGNEAGFLAAPVTIPAQPVSYEYSRRVIFALNIKDRSLLMVPAERADVIVDFSSYPDGTKFILYNDCPAPAPGFDPRYDYFTGDPDNSSGGGAPPTLPGFGPNTRTLMQIVIDPTGPASTWNGMPTLNTAWNTAYKTYQDPPLVPQAAYGPAFGTTFTDQFLSNNIVDPTLTFIPFGSTTAIKMPTQDKAIIENWDMVYGRMNALLGGALPNLGPQAGTATPLSYFNPTTEVILSSQGTLVGTAGDHTQIWRVDHQGVDLHAIHFHLVNVQVINRVALDGTVFMPEPNEIGWKETVQMPPALDTILAIRAKQPVLPWPQPISVRYLDPTSPPNAAMLDSAGVTITNTIANFGHEYVWHCHLLGHEENDMMRPLVERKPAPIDFDIDGISEVSFYTSTTGVWSIQPSSGAAYTVTWGIPGDIPVPGDYDRDGKTDTAVYRPSNGWWIIVPSSNPSAPYLVGWGAPGDIPVPGDYDGDGKTDTAVYRPSNGWWIIVPSSNPSAPYAVGWGAPGDIPIPGDYDGDLKTDVAVYRPSNGWWIIVPSSNPSAPYLVGWGAAGDKPVPGDYDGDGKTDVAVYRPTTGGWIIVPSSNPSAPYLVGWGAASDIPVPGDYDGDGKTDLAVYRPSTGAWIIVPSSNPSAPYLVTWGGGPNDIPLTYNRASY